MNMIMDGQHNSLLGQVMILLFTVAIITHGQSVTSVSRSSSIVSGGLSTFVEGTGFNSSQHPHATITMNYRSNEAVTFRGEDCEVVSSTRLSCTLPGISTPLDYALPNVENSENPLLNEQGVITFRIGISFSSTSEFEAFSDLDMYTDPFLETNDIDRAFTIWTRRFIVVRGRHLSTGVSLEDYVVRITNQLCVVDFVNQTYLTCHLPLDIPVRDAGDFSTICVHVGNHMQVVGQIRYRVPVFADGDANLPVLDYNPNYPLSRISVHGESVMVGLIPDNYDVLIGQGYCEDIRLEPTRLSCRGPNESPSPTSRFTQHPHHYPQLLITIPKSNLGNFQYTYHAAFVRYVNHNYTNDELVLFDTSGPGATLPPGVVSNAITGSDDKDTVDNDDSNNSAVLWIVASLFVAMLFAVIGVLLCCLCCPGLCGIPPFRHNRPRIRKMRFDSDYSFGRSASHIA